MQQEALKHRLDAHLHLQTIPWNYCFAETQGRAIIRSFLVKGGKSICNGTSPLDWELVLELSKLFPGEIVPYYGVHPWYVDALPEDWLDHLNSCLVKNGSGIGEIGLDRSASSKAFFDHQMDVFKAQLNLAVSLNIPVAIHCVRAWGILLEILKEKIVIKIDNKYYSKIPVMIHSFSGSLETMKILTNMGFFISFSPFLLTVKADYLREILKETPLEKILIESDFSYSKNISVNNQSLGYNRNLTMLYNLIGSIKDVDFEYLQKVILENGKVFTDRALNWQ